MPRKTMTPPEKRRAPASGSGSPSRIVRGTLGTSSSSPSTTASARGSVISPPPRAALSGTSSPAPEERRSRANSGSSGLAPSLNSVKDGPMANTSGPGNSSGAMGSGNGNVGAANGPPPSAAATQHLLKEREARIAHLERELGIMEGEFQRELDKLSANESETAAFWQAKHSALNQQFLRTDTELRLLRAEVEMRDAERDELKAGWDTMRRQLREKDDETRELRGQVRGLKEWVSMSTRSDGGTQTSDEVFGEGMARLGNGLQNWVIVNFRKAKIDLSKADENTTVELGRLVPMYEELASTSKVNLLQSLISRLLMEQVFDAYFVGLSSNQTQQLTQVETLLASFADSPGPINQWRSLTLSIFKRDASQKLQTETASLIEAIISKTNGVLDSITDLKTTEPRDQGLRALIASAIELQRLLVTQKAVFNVIMPEILPHQQIMFDAATMEDIGGEDEESLTDREICCVTFPGIIKRGDESGEQLQYRNVIAKSRVMCTPE